VTPKCVDVNHRKGSVQLFRELDSNRVTAIVHKIMRGEKRFLGCLPTFTIEAPHGKHPLSRIVGSRVWRPRPYCIGMKQPNKSLCVEGIPRGRFAVNQRLNFAFHCCDGGWRLLHDA
jgi:hypothetical protein